MTRTLGFALLLSLLATGASASGERDLFRAHARMVLDGVSYADVVAKYYDGDLSKCDAVPGKRLDCEADKDADFRFRFRNGRLIAWSAVDINVRRCAAIERDLVDAHGYPKGNVWRFKVLRYSFTDDPPGCYFGIARNADYTKGNK